MWSEDDKFQKEDFNNKEISIQVRSLQHQCFVTERSKAVTLFKKGVLFFLSFSTRESLQYKKFCCLKFLGKKELHWTAFGFAS